MNKEFDKDKYVNRDGKGIQECDICGFNFSMLDELYYREKDHYVCIRCIARFLIYLQERREDMQGKEFIKQLQKHE